MFIDGFSRFVGHISGYFHIMQGRSQDEEIAILTKICCECGVTYVKTATGSQEFPDLNQVEIMKANLSGNTKIKVSGVPRTFTLPAVLYMFEELGVSLVGTRSAGKLVESYKKYLEERQ